MKTIRVVGLILGFILLIIALFWVLWLFQPRQHLNVYVLDKTVPDPSFEQHSSLFWILNHYKFNGGNLKKNYYGFYPQRPYKNKKYITRKIRFQEILTKVDSLDVLYYADTYGVYFDEWFQGKHESAQSSLIEGGMNVNDYTLLMEMMKQNKLVVVEYNCLANPTTEFVRAKTENLLGVRWTGWVGKYFNSLNPEDGEIEPWLVDLYKSSNFDKWPFTKGGLVMVNNFNRVIVLEDGVSLKNKPEIITNADLSKKSNVPSRIFYSNWFDVVQPDSTMQTLANYNINVTETGDSILSEYSIPLSFPAILNKTTNNNTYYFAGNFANNPIYRNFKHFYRSESWSRMFSSSKADFFWNYYMPLMNSVLTEYANKKEAGK